MHSFAIRAVGLKFELTTNRYVRQRLQEEKSLLKDLSKYRNAHGSIRIIVF